MGDAGGKRPKRGQLLLPFDNGAAFDQLRAERSNLHAVNHARSCKPQNQHQNHQDHQKALQASQGLI